MPGKITMENVESVFRTAEVDEGQAATIHEVSESFVNTARKILSNVPDCAHRSAALRDLLVAKWACVDAISKRGEI